MMVMVNGGLTLVNQLRCSIIGQLTGDDVAMQRDTARRDTILIVEGDAIAREILGQFLHLAGYHVLSAATGEEGLLLLRKERERVDWLLTATALPGLVDGWIVADEYQTWHPARAVVYATDRAPQEKAGAVMVPRPVSPPDALAALKRVAGIPIPSAPPSLPITLAPVEPAASPRVRPSRRPRGNHRAKAGARG
jgi:two-component system OmpR family response regulator